MIDDEGYFYKELANGSVIEGHSTAAYTALRIRAECAEALLSALADAHVRWRPVTRNEPPDLVTVELLATGHRDEGIWYYPDGFEPSFKWRPAPSAEATP